jgi:phosphatidylglycerophosphatase A
MGDAERLRGTQLVAVLCASVFGLGFLKPGPGTWASVATGIVAWLLIAHAPVNLIQPVLALAAALVFMIGIAACGSACRWLRLKDPPQIVIDEVAGVLCALACVPAAISHIAPATTVILAVVLFRVFDIAKPWPVYCLEAFPGAVGIMADDLAAGLIAGALTAAAVH